MYTDFTIGYIYCGIAVICAFIMFFDARTILEVTSRNTLSVYVFLTFVSAGLSAIFDCAFALREMEIVEFSQTASYIFTLAYIIFSNLIGVFWILYSETKMNSWFAKSKRNFMFLLVPFCVLLIAVISTPFTHWYFYFKENHYQRGALFSVLSVIILVFLVENGVSALIRSFQKKNYVNRKEYKRFFVFMVIYLSIQIIQIKLPDVFPYRSVGTMLILNVTLQQNLKEMIGVDALTHINNRFEAERYLGEMMKSKDQFEIVMIDVDKFKSINDTYGHPEGDKALQYVADALRKSASKGCFIARMGGDEFILINNDLSNSISDAESRINENLAGVLEQFNNKYRLTVSAGYTLKDESIDSIPDLIKLADEGLYRQKKLKARK